MKQEEIKSFAMRVERICDFLLNKTETHSEDKETIQKLKEEAADIQADRLDSLTGLNDYMRGFPKEG
jgi:cell shape-determining protein MreC